MGAFDSIKKSLEKSANEAKNSVQDLSKKAKDIDIADMTDSVKNLARKGGGIVESIRAKNELEKSTVKSALQQTKNDSSLISTEAALKIIYYLIAVDGQIQQNELEKFDAIGHEMDSQFGMHKDAILKECQEKVQKAKEDDEYYYGIRECVHDEIQNSVNGGTGDIQGKLLIWDLLAVSASDGECSQVELLLIRYIAHVLQINQTVLLEMESTVQTMLALDKEEQWLKNSRREYAAVESELNEIADRRQTIMTGIGALITD